MRVLVVDDSRTMRTVISDILTSAGSVVVGEAVNGTDAVQKAASLKPDLITLDVEMPGMNGIAALGEIMQHAPTKVLLVSSLTTAGADVTLEGLALGAIDFVPKPSTVTGLDLFGTQLRAALQAAGCARVRGTTPAAPRPTEPLTPRTRTLRPPRLIVVASSTGGPAALAEFLEGFDAPPPAPMLVVQHMPVEFTARLANRLDRAVDFPVSEAAEGIVQPGEVVVARGGTHLGYRKGRTFFDDSEPIGRLKPAADITFRHVAAEQGSSTLAVVLTGMGQDGLEGSVAITAAGGQVIAQDPHSAVVDGMPRAIREAGLAVRTGTPTQLAQLIERITPRRVA